MSRIDELITKLENTYNSPVPSDVKAKYEIDREKGHATMELSFAVAQSVLSKLLDPQGTTADEKEYHYDSTKGSYITDNSGVRDNIRMMISALAHEHNKILYGEDTQNKYGTNHKTSDADYNGIVESFVDGTTTTRGIAAIDGATYSDGMELVSAANAALIEEITKCIDRIGVVKLDLPYECKKLGKRTYIGYTDITPKYITEELTPMQVVFKAVRRSVKDNASIKVDTTRYTYLSEIIDNETIYKRLPKELTYTLTTSARGLDSVGEYAIDLLDAIDRANLTARQAQILNYRYDGIGIPTIGEKLGVTKQAVSKQLGKIREKIGGAKYYDDIIAVHDREVEQAKKDHDTAAKLRKLEVNTREAINTKKAHLVSERKDRIANLLSSCDIKFNKRREERGALVKIEKRREADRQERVNMFYAKKREMDKLAQENMNRARTYFTPMVASECNLLIDLANDMHVKARDNMDRARTYFVPMVASECDLLIGLALEMSSADCYFGYSRASDCVLLIDLAYSLKVDRVYKYYTADLPAPHYDKHYGTIVHYDGVSHRTTTNNSLWSGCVDWRKKGLRSTLSDRLYCIDKVRQEARAKAEKARGAERERVARKRAAERKKERAERKLAKDIGIA